MSTSSFEDITRKLDFIEETKSSIASAIVAKGQEVNPGDTFRSYASKILAIESGGSTDSGSYGRWKRPEGWMQLPTDIITEDVDKVYFLCFVSEHRYNYICFNAESTAGSFKVDWGDGTEPTIRTSPNASSTANRADHVYDFDAVTNEYLEAYDYKQVLVTLEPCDADGNVTGNITALVLGQGVNTETGSTLNASIYHPILEIAANTQELTSLSFSGAKSGGTIRVPRYLRAQRWYNTRSLTSFTGIYTGANSVLEYLLISDASSLANAANLFANTYTLKDFVMLNVNNTTAITATNVLANCALLEFLSFPKFGNNDTMTVTNIPSVRDFTVDANGLVSLTLATLLNMTKLTILNNETLESLTLTNAYSFNNTSLANLVANYLPDRSESETPGLLNISNSLARESAISEETNAQLIAKNWEVSGLIT